MFFRKEVCTLLFMHPSWFLAIAATIAVGGQTFNYYRIIRNIRNILPGEPQKVVSKARLENLKELHGLTGIVFMFAGFFMIFFLKDYIADQKPHELSTSFSLYFILLWLAGSFILFSRRIILLAKIENFETRKMITKKLNPLFLYLGAIPGICLLVNLYMHYYNNPDSSLNDLNLVDATVFETFHPTLFFFAASILAVLMAVFLTNKMLQRIEEIPAPLEGATTSQLMEQQRKITTKYYVIQAVFSIVPVLLILIGFEGIGKAPVITPVTVLVAILITIFVFAFGFIIIYVRKTRTVAKIDNNRLKSALKSRVILFYFSLILIMFLSIFGNIAVLIYESMK